jgi:adenylate cyclase
MTQETYKRKLSAILSADVEGYSRLMGEDEDATIRTLTSYRELMTTLINKHRGRVVDSPGDNLLAEFSSVVDAVRCAVEIQEELRIRNAELPETKRMHFRIGINLGDVVEEGERIYGDGINIAARVEGLAEGGGICISGTVYDSIKNKLSLTYESLGEHAVKNITEPVRVYRMRVGPEVVVQPKSKPWRKTALAALAVLIVAAGAWSIWNFYFRPPPIEPASVEKMAFPLPDKPSIAVLAFENMSGDPKQEYFSDGITEQIISSLSKVPLLFVVARTSTFTYKGKPVKVQKVAEDLGVRYVMEGSIQKSGNRVRITAQLIDAITGHHIWSERYDRDLRDIFALQDEITIEIIKAMRVEIEGDQYRYWIKWGTKNLKAYEKTLQGLDRAQGGTKQDFAYARQLYEEAIALDPNWLWPQVHLGWTHFWDGRAGWSESPRKSFKEAFELAQKILAVDDSFDLAHSLLGAIYVASRQYEKGLAEAERAVALNPNGAFSYSILGGTVSCLGRWEDSIVLYKKAIRLDPSPRLSYLIGLGRAYFMTAQYDEAISTLKKALNIDPDSLSSHAFLAACYSSMGRDAEATAAAKKVLDVNPKFSLESYAKTLPYKNKADVRRHIAALRKAGLPDKPPLPLPGKPSIAVLPFTNMSEDPKQEYFSDGMTEEIIMGLSKVPDLFVIARNSTFVYKGKSVNIQQVSKELGVRYVLEGSVRKAENRVRITAQLIDATTGNHVWSERYDRDLKDIFALQDEITMKIMTALQVKLTVGAAADLKYHGTKNLEAYEKILMARHHFYRRTKEDVRLGQQFVKEAIDIDSEYDDAYRMMGWLYLDEVWFGMTKSPAKSIEKAEQMAQKAISLRGYQAPDYCLLSSINLLKKDFDHAVEYGEKSVELGPNYSSAHFILGMALRYAGQYREAISEFEKAIRLDPITPINRLNNLGWSYLLAEEYESAILIFNKAIKRNPDYLFAYMGLSAAYNLSGDIEKSHWAAENVLRINPKFSLDAYEKRSPIKIEEDKKRIISAMRKAGLE